MTPPGPAPPDVVASLAGARVLVVGDVMLDEYAFGDVQRVSPEAPVPLVELTRRMSACGGAANAAHGVVALGGTALLAGVIGDDAEGAQLRSEVEACGVAGDGLVVVRGRPTTTKLRVIARAQHVVRIDHEHREEIDRAVRDRLIAWVRFHVRDVDAVIVSDYAKGVLSPATCLAIIEAAREAGAPVVVDPKGPDFTKYLGASVVTPNLREAASAARMALDSDARTVASIACRVAEIVPGANVLVTLGDDGMHLRSADGHVMTATVEAQAVHDVTGAGDTVVATLATALARGVSLQDAVRLSNQAAAIAVSRMGAVAVTLKDLETVCP
jgi:rfaE bifunctional protein kinase chain/domain